MIEPVEIQGFSARAVRLERFEELEEAPRALGLDHVRASLVLIGGADGMSDDDHVRLRPLFGALADLAAALRAAILDGGTDTGVMRLMGRAREQTTGSFPLVGVLPSSLAAHAGVELEPNHTHFVLVPGDEFGEEAPWLARLGDVVGEGSVTVLVNGGDISLRDAQLCVAARRPLVVVAGSGRTADRIVAAADEASERIAGTGLVRPVDVDDRAGLAAAIGDVLAGRN